MTTFRKNGLFLDHTSWVEGACKDRINAYMLLHSPFPYFICNMTMFLKKLNFDQLALLPGSGEGSMGKIFATVLMHASFP